MSSMLLPTSLVNKAAVKAGTSCPDLPTTDWIHDVFVRNNLLGQELLTGMKD